MLIQAIGAIIHSLEKVRGDLAKLEIILSLYVAPTLLAEPSEGIDRAL